MSDSEEDERLRVVDYSYWEPKRPDHRIGGFLRLERGDCFEGFGFIKDLKQETANIEIDYIDPETNKSVAYKISVYTRMTLINATYTSDLTCLFKDDDYVKFRAVYVEENLSDLDLNLWLATRMFQYHRRQEINADPNWFLLKLDPKLQEIDRSFSGSSIPGMPPTRKPPFKTITDSQNPLIQDEIKTMETYRKLNRLCRKDVECGKLSFVTVPKLKMSQTEKIKILENIQWPVKLRDLPKSTEDFRSIQEMVNFVKRHGQVPPTSCDCLNCFEHFFLVIATSFDELYSWSLKHYALVLQIFFLQIVGRHFGLKINERGEFKTTNHIITDFEKIPLPGYTVYITQIVKDIVDGAITPEFVVEHIFYGRDAILDFYS